MTLEELVTFTKTLSVGVPIAAITVLHAIFIQKYGTPRMKHTTDLVIRVGTAILIALCISILLSFPIALKIAIAIDSLPIQSTLILPPTKIVEPQSLLSVKIWGTVAVSVFGIFGLLNVVVPVALKNSTHVLWTGLAGTLLLVIGTSCGNLFNLMAAENAWTSELTVYTLIGFVSSGLCTIFLLLYIVWIYREQRKIS